MEKFAESRNALHREVGQIGTLGQSKSSELRGIADKVINILIRQARAAREVHNPELVEGYGDRSKQCWIKCGRARRRAGGGLWGWDIHEIPRICTDAFKYGRVVHTRDCLEIRDRSGGQRLVVVHLKLP